MPSLKATEIFSFSWAFASTRLADYYRYYLGETFTVDTKSGPVKGYKISSSFDYSYYNFHGIPYAKPPIGELRFKDPEPFEPTDKIINEDFIRGGTQACQKDLLTHKVTGAENCLHLSIYTRDIKPEKLKPVMLWIHGGAYIFGSNTKDFYNPEFLLRNDVIVVTVNYRLGAFGFLNFDDPEVDIPGNAGLKDQCMAMKWVKENCANFGGDPDNITLFGESAGAASASCHMVSEMSKDLFHKVILMSGTAYSPWTIRSVYDWSYRLGRKLGWDGEGGDKACFDVIRDASADNIIRAQDKLLTLEDRIKYVFIPFGPSIEKFKSSQCFLPEDPRILNKNSWSKDIPMIVGGCSNEGLLFHRMMLKKPSTLKKINLANALPFDEFKLSQTSSECQKYGEIMKKFYFGFLPISEETIFVYLYLLGDKSFNHAFHRTILQRNHNNSAPTYLYRFDFDSYMNLTKRLFSGKNAKGACHGDDMSYLFKTALFAIPKKETKEWNVVEKFCESYTNFAHSGDPNGTKSTLSPEWKPADVTKDDNGNILYKCYNFGNEIDLIDYPELERLRFWDQIYKDFKHDLY